MTLKDDIEQLLKDYFDDGSGYLTDDEFERCAYEIMEMVKDDAKSR